MNKENKNYWYGTTVGAFATLVAQLVSPISRNEAMYLAWFTGSIILIMIGYNIIKGKKK